MYICTKARIMIKEKLRKIRTDKGISQKQIATALPTDVSNYNRKELGEVKITKAEWEKLSHFLEVPFDEIFEEEETKAHIQYKKAIFNDQSVGVQYVEIMPSIVENLQDLIAILKHENQALKDKIKLLAGE